MGWRSTMTCNLFSQLNYEDARRCGLCPEITASPALRPRGAKCVIDLKLLEEQTLCNYAATQMLWAQAATERRVNPQLGYSFCVIHKKHSCVLKDFPRLRAWHTWQAELFRSSDKAEVTPSGCFSKTEGGKVALFPFPCFPLFPVQDFFLLLPSYYYRC